MACQNLLLHTLLIPYIPYEGLGNQLFIETKSYTIAKDLATRQKNVMSANIITTHKHGLRIH